MQTKRNCIFYKRKRFYPIISDNIKVVKMSNTMIPKALIRSVYGRRGDTAPVTIGSS